MTDVLTAATGRRRRHWKCMPGALVALFAVAGLGAPAVVTAQSGDPIFANGFEPTLPAAPTVRVLRDDRVATIEMDYNAEDPWGQFWVMSGSPDDDAGFLVTWWPQQALKDEITRARGGGNDAGGTCVNPEHFNAAKLAVPSIDLPPGARWLVTANRRVQLQPLDNDRAYVVRVQRLSARGQITTQAAEIAFNGGDGARVAALRQSLTAFDDFNLPLGPADERLWNNAQMVSTDERYNLFFINDQLHVHTIQGTRRENTGDKSQTSQRFRKALRIPATGQRRVVFDMDSPLSSRSVWYLDFNPMSADLTGHASFFDEEGALGLPAGILRLRAQGQFLSVSIVDMQGASHQIASVDMEDRGRQAVPNVRRSFDMRVGTTAVQVFIDGREVINAPYAPYTLPAGDYELLWVDFGYNTTKDQVPYFLHHWDNFGFDGPVVDARTTHNYVTRIQGSDYRKANRGNNENPTFTVKIPDDLRPTTTGATAEAWLVYTYQMGDYSNLTIEPGDVVRINGGAGLPLPQPRNNSVPTNPALTGWGVPHTARIKIADLTSTSAAPFVVGDNAIQFFAVNAGILNLHVEVKYPPGSAPAYTPPAQIHHFPLHAELPRFGPPARLQRIADVDTTDAQWLGNPNLVRIPVSGDVALNVEVGNRSWAGWAPELMHSPVQSTELWSTGGVAGIQQIEVFLRRVGTGTGPGDRVVLFNTAVDAPAPQGRYKFTFDSRPFPDGDYELFVRATTPSGLASHPSYGDEMHHFDSAELSGAYYPMPIRIDN